VNTFSLPYGRTQLNFQIESRFNVEKIVPLQTQPLNDPEKAIMLGLENPLSMLTLQDFINAKSIGIAINDKTRPVPKPNPVSAILSYLERVGIQREVITLFIGSGTHKPMTVDEYKQILPDWVIANYTIIAHDCDNSPMVNLGRTKFNTPILINKAYYSSDLKITIGSIEPHHFMGFSGGVKTAAIGLAGRETITANHAMLIDAHAQSGTFDTNPLRQDIEEIGQKTKIHFSLGSILDEEKHILKVFFGEPEAVMQAAIPDVQRIFGKEVPEPYDLVIASPGGYPKDINLYQAEKGLTHAARITSDGGWVILLAECSEGSGSQSFEDYISKAESLQKIREDFKRGFFKIGPHKAFQIAREAERVQIAIVSNLAEEKLRKWKLNPAKPNNINSTIQQITRSMQPGSRIGIMPAATRTMTEIKNGK
jgi:nickel-dependent lactate racemase